MILPPQIREKIAFRDVIGYDSIKNELLVISDMFLYKGLYDQIGATLPHGVLIKGEPGLGKTLLANCFIKACECTNYLIRNDCSYDNLVKNITKVFESASKEADRGKSCIIFFDDLDKFAEGTEDEDKKIFVNIQSLMESIKGKRILILATVNNIDKIPASLYRSGRFDKIFDLSVPSLKDAISIIKYYLSKKKVSPFLNYDDVAKMVKYQSCASLETLINNSAIRAKYNRRNEITMEDIVLSYVGKELNYLKDDEGEKVKKSDEDENMVALHEAGHVAVFEILVPNSIGFAHVFDESEGTTRLCKSVNRRPLLLLGALAGKAACELFDKGRVASGCDNDLMKAYHLISDGIKNNATLGYQSLFDHDFDSQTSEISLYQNEAVVRAELQRNDFLVKDILMKNKEFLFKIRDVLLKKKYILFSDIQNIKKKTKIVPYTIY